MSRLLVVTHPLQAAGFQLAGVEAYGVPDLDAAQELLEDWLEHGLEGLCAIDESLLEHLPRRLLHRLERSEQLQHIAIPSGRTQERPTTRRDRIAQMLRMAVGFHIAFEPERAQGVERG